MNTACISITDNQKALHVMQQLILKVEFILQTNQEQQYADFLKELMYDSEFADFEQTIREDIKQFGIADQEIIDTMKELIPTI
ncbi:hypothetical protein [Metabacillus sp. 22489]|uniref:hypothetical protein n=1 Tax=Metabacillus sp. 22489 TaxID=3453928 RepID=UPI003F87FFB3